MERHYPRCQFSESFFVRQCFAYRVTDRAIIDFNRTVVDIFANYSVRYMIRLKGWLYYFSASSNFLFILHEFVILLYNGCGVLATIENSCVVSSIDLYYILRVRVLYIFLRLLDHLLYFFMRSSIISLSFSYLVPSRGLKVALSRTWLRDGNSRSWSSLALNQTGLQ